MLTSLRFAVVYLAVFFLASGQCNPQAEASEKLDRPRHILIIRHAEKTGESDDIRLSKMGLKRADELFRLFQTTRDRPDAFPFPDFIFAASNSSKSQRPVDTVAPLARKFGLAINSSHSTRYSLRDTNEGKVRTDKGPVEGVLLLRQEIFGESRYAGKTILVSWRHSSIPELARAFGAKDVPAKWADACFDRVWQITFDQQGRATFFNRPQRLLVGDSPK